jgi:hypothetical protein
MLLLGMTHGSDKITLTQHSPNSENQNNEENLKDYFLES